MNYPAFFTCKDEIGILGLITGDKKEMLKCLGEHFKELDPSESEGAGEKHVPCVKVNGSSVTVQVGIIFHPMTEEHSIGWIYLETSTGGHLRFLSPNQEPSAEFALAPEEKVVSAYAYCNLHGFWKSEL